MPTDGNTPRGPELSVLVSLMEIYESYHNHKEQMGYAISTLQVLGALYVIFVEPDPLTTGARTAVAVGAGVLGALFVEWQLQRRREADRIATAARTLAFRWSVNGPPLAQDLALVAIHDPRLAGEWPSAFQRELSTPALRWRDPRLGLAEWLTRLAVWGVLILVFVSKAGIVPGLSR